MRDTDTIEMIIAQNSAAGRASFAGLNSREISARNRAAMFGENDEAFPDQAEWSAWVD